MNFYISDVHLFHKNVTDEGTNFENRPFKTLEEMHSTIKENWNRVVTDADRVYILGDFVWKENEDAIKLVSALRGNKHLILGNHDHIKDQRYKQLFVEIVDYKEIMDIVDGKEYRLVLSHFPLAFWNHQHIYNKDGRERGKWSVHLYGHVHNSKEEKYYREFIDQLNTKYEVYCKAYNVGCMLPYMNYTPRTLKELLENRYL